MAVNQSVILALSAAVEASPEDDGLRLHLAPLLLEAGDPASALAHARAVLARDPANLQALRIAADAAKSDGQPDIAAGYLRLVLALGGNPAPAQTESAPEPEISEDPYDLSSLNDFVMEPEAEPLERSLDEQEAEERERVAVHAYAGEDEDEPELYIERPDLRLADVAGMADVKRRLEVAFLGPLRNPELQRMYRVSLRGGLLLYGPPGCGKTFIARAVAGELGAKFIPVGLSDVFDMWFGESERKLQSIFDTARRNAPCVLFFDEIDALGLKRSQLRGAAGRSLVNQLLSEMDSVGSNNDGVFVLAASNCPWDIDAALRRPGRFDRMMLVLPPDEPAREAALRYHMKDRPGGGVDYRWLASHTKEYSGADLAHLCQSAAEFAIEASLTGGGAREIDMRDFRRALKEVRPSTRAWFEAARSYAMFANQDGAYDDLMAYIKVNRL